MHISCIVGIISCIKTHLEKKTIIEFERRLKYITWNTGWLHSRPGNSYCELLGPNMKWI